MKYTCDKFESERELTKTASRSSFFKPLLYESDFFEFEMEGLFGIPDLVVANVLPTGKVDGCAFEMKLSNWKRALRQAFRYKAFAHRSYVVMDEYYVSRAERHIDWFRDSNIGLISVTRKDWIIAYFHPDPEEPYSTDLTSKFTNRVIDSYNQGVHSNDSCINRADLDAAVVDCHGVRQVAKTPLHRLQPPTNEHRIL